jgi:mannose-1-phosphate guanylyltransferase
MQLYEEAIQEAIEKQQMDISLLLGLYLLNRGYGYIERKGDDVISFRENPTRFSLDFIAKGNFLWNSGMFCLRREFVGRLKAFILKYTKNQNWFGKAIKWHLDLALSLDIPSISIDYAVMERSKKIKKWFPLNLTGLIWVLLNRYMTI